MLQLKSLFVVAAACLGALATPLESRDASPAEQQQYLSAHNSFRAQHGAAPLTWNANLGSKAQQWANRCVFQHSGGSLGPYGENLAAGTGSFPISAAIKLWTDESSSYNPSNPQPSHFTQVVWKSSTELGCAVAQCPNLLGDGQVAAFYVCEYSPAGNVIGQFPQNVQP
ncbi:PR-1-like protein [Amylostereum chailletii]|nr:PR-1-like protein [Amylostereum chailletii]